MLFIGNVMTQIAPENYYTFLSIKRIGLDVYLLASTNVCLTVTKLHKVGFQMFTFGALGCHAPTHPSPWSPLPYDGNP
jgi:hypothetical protein